MSAEPQPERPGARNSRATAIGLAGLAELALLAVIVAALAGERLGTVAELIAPIPGGRLAVAGVALALLLIAAFAMTLLLSA